MEEGITSAEYSQNESGYMLDELLDIDREVSELTQILSTLELLVIEYRANLNKWMECYWHCPDIIDYEDVSLLRHKISEQRTLIDDLGYTHVNVSCIFPPNHT